MKEKARKTKNLYLNNLETLEEMVQYIKKESDSPIMREVANSSRVIDVVIVECIPIVLETFGVPQDKITKFIEAKKEIRN